MPTYQRSPTDARDVLRAVLGPLDGAQVSRGCDYCGAYQTVRPGGVAGLWRLTTWHDDHCLWLAARGVRA